MNRFVAVVLMSIVCVAARAQVYIDMDMFSKNSNTSIKLYLRDAKSGEPLSYATVYLIPQGDTTITEFSLSDAKGKVEIEEVITGKYELHAELIGYKPYVKVHDLKMWGNDLGIIKLEEDPEYIDAANITAMVNPVTISKDTIEYNAAAFPVGDNAMLEDLLKKMPGMEVDENGTVKVNGEAVEKITVGGKTFFFNDPAMAVKNLPAKIVDKIKVIDKDKDEAEFNGVSTRDDKEKVMDVVLKEEYKQGWFGNAKLSGGSTASGDTDNEFIDDIGLLYNGNAMAAWYNEKDQLTLLGNARNANAPGGSTAILINEDYFDDELTQKRGQVTSAQAGINYDTERIKGMEAGASVSYSFMDKDAREKSARTAFQQDGSELYTDGRYDGHGRDHKITNSWTIENKEKDKYIVEFEPVFQFLSRDREAVNTSSTRDKSGVMNESHSETAAHSDVFKARGYYTFGVKDMGKEKRNFTVSGNYQYKNTIGSSLENSKTVFGTTSDLRNLNYDNTNGYFGAETVLTYVEPISEHWAIQTRFTTCYVNDDNVKNAFNGLDGSFNDYYSSKSTNTDLLFRERLLAQWEKDDDTKLVIGALLDEENNVTHARNIGIDNTVGEGEWIINWSPYAEIEWKKDNSRLSINYRGNSDTPSGASILPSLDISNPVYVSTGNIYLKPSFKQTVWTDWSFNDPKSYLFTSLWGYATYTDKPRVYASWFDDNGIRYSIPVNSRKPSAEFQLGESFRMPLDKKKRFTIKLNTYCSIRSDVNYQADGRLPGIDKDRFNYHEMMSSFWGDASGSRFYSGKSGFVESKTIARNLQLVPGLEYKLDRFTMSVSSVIWNVKNKYTFDPTADMDAWQYTFDCNALLQTKKGFEFNTDAQYMFYRGYSYGSVDPALIWNARISKSVKSLVFSLSCSDILDQNKSLRRNASAEYFEDVYSNVMGRYILFGISFNFGKMNARNNSNVEGAMWNMMLQ